MSAKHTCDPELPVDAETCAGCAATEAQMRREYDAHKRAAAGAVDPEDCDHDYDPDEGYTCLNCGKDGREEVMAAAEYALEDR